MRLLTSKSILNFTRIFLIALLVFLTVKSDLSIAAPQRAVSTHFKNLEFVVEIDKDAYHATDEICIKTHFKNTGTETIWLTKDQFGSGSYFHVALGYLNEGNKFLVAQGNISRIKRPLLANACLYGLAPNAELEIERVISLSTCSLGRMSLPPGDYEIGAYYHSDWSRDEIKTLYKDRNVVTLDDGMILAEIQIKGTKKGKEAVIKIN